MKLAILGGGGFRVPLVYRGLLRDGGGITEVTLYDPAPQRLAVIESVLAQQRRAAPPADGAAVPQVSSTTDLDAALGGARFVFSAVRVGGLDGRVRDERVALRLGVLGQETTGPGGIAYGLRTIPVATAVAERVRRLCPDAYVINFTNPVGMITEAMQRVLGDRVIGICDTPSGLGRRIADALGLDYAAVQLDYVGLNHLGWVRRAVWDGRDLLPGLLADDAALASLEETGMFGAAWLRSLGCVPNEYLYYYYFNREAVRSILAQPATRGEFLARQQAGFYEAAARTPDRAFQLWERALTERRALYMAEAKATAKMDGTAGAEGTAQRPAEPAGAGGYEQIALGVMGAIGNRRRSTMILNVRNGGALPGLDADAVVEVPCAVDGSGARPIPATAPEGYQLGLMQQVKAVERLTIEAALTGSADAALRAFALHPLVDSVSVATKLLRGYAAEIPEVAAAVGLDGRKSLPGQARRGLPAGTPAAAELPREAG